MNLETYSQQVYNTTFNAGLKPDENLTVSQWAEKYRFLSHRAGAERGPWRTNRVPYSRKIMDVLSARHPAQKVVSMTDVGGNQRRLTRADADMIQEKIVFWRKKVERLASGNNKPGPKIRFIKPV